MTDYQPLDLSSHCNVGAAFIGPNAKPTIGAETLQGLPFQIGSAKPDPAKCFVGFGGDGAHKESFTIPIGKAARRVIVAHSLLESKIAEGEHVGTEIAVYTFRLANGKEERVPIREKFEISRAGQGYLAYPSGKTIVAERYDGQWSAIGRRQTELRPEGKGDYSLWVWESPSPDVVIESLKIEPKGRKFVLGGLTLSHAEEWPFVQQARREVILTLPQEADATKAFDLEVEVDRGVATYAFPLPAQSNEDYLKDNYKGFGQDDNGKNNPAYVEIAAIDSATVAIKSGAEELGRANWGELQSKGKVETPRVRLELADGGRNWVHVKILDDKTGKPVPCRVHFRSPRGIPYQPHGHHNQVNSNLGSWHSDIGGDLRLGHITYAYTDGTCQGWLPRGDVIVDVARGFEYEPLRETVKIERDQRELTLRLKRVADMAADRWYSGDSHVHFLGAQGAHFESAAEGLNIVNLLASQWGHLFTNTEDFSGGPTIVERNDTIVYCSQENRQHFLGHLILWGLKKPVMPWCSDGPNESELGGGLDTTMSDWADQTHAQGGTIVVPHFPNPNGEPATLIALGKADAVEMMAFGAFSHIEYYRYLNGGYRLPLVGGTDKMSSDVPVGLVRTYAQLAPNEPFTYDNWSKAVREGRTFLSAGPMIKLSVEGRGIGETVRVPKGGGMVEVEAEATSIFPMHVIQIVEKGKVVAQEESAAGTRTIKLKAKIKVDGHTWITARCAGPGYTGVQFRDGWKRQGSFAHTSPVYVAAGESAWEMFDAQTAQYMTTLIEGSLQYIRHTAPKRRDDFTLQHHGESNHQAWLERPFLQALEAVHQKMHKHGIRH